MDRMTMLKEILAANPGDSFARYGLAMEYSNAGEFETSLAEFATLLKNTPDYTPGYFMAAQTLAKASRVDEARKIWSALAKDDESGASAEARVRLGELEAKAGQG